MSTYVAIAKLDFVSLVDDDESVIPDNIGALKMGLQALLREDADDDARALQLWANAEQLLENDTNDDVGAGAQSMVIVNDDFSMSQVSAGSDGYNWPWNGYGG